MTSVFSPDDKRMLRRAWSRHPAFDTASDRDHDAFVMELDRDLADFARLRDRLAVARVLEAE